MQTAIVHQPATKYALREEWLNAAMPMVRALFAEHGYTVPPKIRCTCGWPSKRATATKKRRIGECWTDEASADTHFEIFLSPVLSDSLRVLDVLVHEVVHATVGLAASHKAPFAKCAGAVGLVKPWTATTASPELVETLKSWVADLGPYPHGSLTYSGLNREKQGTRMLLMECECTLKIRTTQKWLDEYGPAWPCPCGGEAVCEGLSPTLL